MFRVLVCGAGKIGQFVAVQLMRSDNYTVTLIDSQPADTTLERLCQQYPAIHFNVVSVEDHAALQKLMQKTNFDAIIACVHAQLNIPLAQLALEHHAHYFNLTEDRETKAAIVELTADAKTAFVPQCGVAPGLVDIVAHYLIQQFDTPFDATLSVGALPQRVSNRIHYELSWSIDGLVNEYLNPCRVIEGGQDKEVPALSGVEALHHQGATYEMFHTSGGLGTLADYYHNTLKNLHYKTIRYPGHVEKMQAIFEQFSHSHDKIVGWFNENIPFTNQDMVIMYVSVTGLINNVLSERSFVHQWYCHELDGIEWNAIQWTTASEVCAMCDLVLYNPEKYTGLVLHQDVDLKILAKNRFMRHFNLLADSNV